MDVEPTRIPHQLLSDEFRFIKIPRGSKGGPGNEKGWNRDRNYGWCDETLVDHLLAGGNYGLFPREGSPYAILDVDNFAGCLSAGLIEGIVFRTFTVATGSSTAELPKFHFYLRLSEPLDGVFRLSDGAVKLGDLYAQHPGQARGYVVGPGSINRDTGGLYRVVANLPILSVDTADFMARLEALETRAMKPTVIRLDTTTAAEAVRPQRRGALLSEQLGLTVPMFLMPENPRHRGDEIEGKHPYHDSATGTNLTIGPDRWYCRRHGTGGGPLEAFAVAEGLIDCSEAGPGCLKPVWRRLKERLIEKGYAVRARTVSG